MQRMVRELNRSGRSAGLPVRMWRQRYLYLMLLPALVVIVLFTYRPVMYWIIAFKDYRPGRNMFTVPWVGLSHFRDFFVDSRDAGYVFRNTIVINVTSLFVNLSAAMIFAILMNEIRRAPLRKIVQTASIFPFFVSWVIAYSFFHAIFSANTGLLNALLIRLGVIDKGINLLGDNRYGMRLIIIANLWKSLGYNAVIFLAAIAGIDQEQYEAAAIDGATRLQKIRYITAPGMYTTLAVLLIMNSGSLLSNGLDMFNQFTVATNKRSLEVFDMYVYTYGLKQGRFAYATAVGIFKTVVSLMMLVICNTTYRKLTDRSIF